ncbi:MAG: GspE/PulE family protein [bacterium]|nr:GspE/PulE family protein [bacterium]
MGKKLFRFFSDPAARRSAAAGGTASILETEAAASVESKMRQLIKRDYTPDQIEALKTITSDEGAAHYDEQPVAVQEVVAPNADMLQIIAEQTGLRLINLSAYPKADFRLRSMIGAQQAKSMRVVPVEEAEDGRLVVAIADPSNPMIADDLRLILGREVETVIADETEIEERIELYYGMGDQSLEGLLEKEQEISTDENVITTMHAEIDLSDLEAIASSEPIIKLVNILLMKAINDRSSDIHIEPFPSFIRVRYRVDGVLRELPSPPRSQLVAIISRIKVMSNMNISESRLPQDGRIKLNIEGREVDMRVSTVPTVHGEAIVMRVLDKSMMMVGIGKIGMLDEVLERFKKIILKPNGILLVTGPTGCGKTTTLYAALAEVKDPGEKLITTEDPVEYELDGIQQVNINENVGLTFARCLRSILRQDPDKVLVGEIRDVETAQISVQASLTGHLVFSTLHTNSAAATVTRLLDMGVEPFLITSSLEAIVGQRLVRTICSNCKRPYTPTEDELRDFGVTLKDVREQGISFYHGDGCEECNHTGYHGRLGIFELLEVTDEIRELILERATTDEIQDMALRQGMISMRRDGWIKACMGITTLSEIARQTPKESEAVRLEAESTEEAEPEAEPAKVKPVPEALPKPAPKLDRKRMQIEGEAAMPAYQAGDAQRKAQGG